MFFRKLQRGKQLEHIIVLISLDNLSEVFQKNSNIIYQSLYTYKNIFYGYLCERQNPKSGEVSPIWKQNIT